MDPAKTPLGKMLLEEVTPVVMVIDTPLVEQSCSKNGLSLVNLLTPFSNFTNIDVPVRTASDQPYRLQKFKLRLFNASDIRQPNVEGAKERLKQVITEAGEKDFSASSTSQPKVDDLLRSSESEILPTWFKYFNKELARTLSFSDHEAFDHPVACILAVSSKEEQPINRFIDLFNTNKLPSLLNDGTMDPKIMKYYLLVHDNQDGSPDIATKTLAEMKSTFGPNDCQLLCINSSEDGPIEHQNNPWVSDMADTAPNYPLGSFLNNDDINELKELMKVLSSRHIIPYMEEKVRVLNQQVSATRKGFRNQIKNLWWRKGKDETSDSTTGVYTFSSVESQIRILGDYAFMLGDYELALSNYRLISTDYKLDKAWKRYAGVQEMMGLTYFMLDQSRKEEEYCMENSFTTYMKLGPSGQQNAIRCGLWWAEMLKARNQYKEAATVYFRLCSEEPLHSAVMLEQASYCYMFSVPPMLHKYGFHLVLAGDRYRKCDQYKHAIRTYRGAVSIYKGTTWSHIKDRVHFSTGQLYASLGMYDVAVTHMLEVLACGHQSRATQELFVRDFLETVQKSGKVFEVLKLRLPVVNISSLKVIFEDHRTYASPAAASIKESVWSSLEEDMIPSLTTARTNWLELQSKIIPKKYRESNVCVAGEAIEVSIDFKNPLNIPISLSGVSLICELSAKPEDVKSDVNSSTSENQNDEIHKTAITSGDTTSEGSSFSLSEVDFSLGGGETTVAIGQSLHTPLSNQVQLTVTPKVEGVLKIVGVKWKLSNSVIGYDNFEPYLAKKKVKRGRRKSKNSLIDDLKFLVIKSLPRLEGSIHPLPEKAYTGDLRHLVLELKNPSEFPNLKMKISQPRFLLIGDPEELDVEFPGCLKKKGNIKQQSAPTNHNKKSVFRFPEDISIQKEKALKWPFWLRAAVPGNISLDVTIYYEMEDITDAMKYRVLRMHYNFQVLPSLDVSFQINSCPARLNEFIVRMDVVNKTSSENFWIHQLSSVRHQTLQPVDSSLPSEPLFAGQSVSFFFLLKNSRPSVSDNSISSLSSIPGRDVKLRSQISNEELICSSASPLADFHNCERLNQRTSNEDDASAVDFILISLPHESKHDSTMSERPQIYSHHSCYCSTTSSSPVSWLLEGPRTIHHDFSANFCEVNLKMTLSNSWDSKISVHIKTVDRPNSNMTAQQSPAASANKSGWHDLPQHNEIKVTSDVLGIANRVETAPLESAPPYIWSGSSSTRIQLDPLSTTEIPITICIFSPGTHDLSSYVLSWKLIESNDLKIKKITGQQHQSSGTCHGYPYHLTVLQSV
ncbi:hypothetical protein ACFE04_002169 [Oxalis oulophora]